ncbi:ATP-binding protein [Williamsia maris]|uniref:AAA domain-containing protein n=1 Tax=Williamsia maris TaxID=72806 RepID=A0ABT1HJL1_9NOCA|nr:ATP-binding protein [Williamsia maris]MCP2178118.1 AAA domain-containing protein [Williamsia maris]
MAAPANKEQWRTYCAYDPTPDERRPTLTLKEIQALSDDERRTYNDRRIAYLYEERTIPTRDLRLIENTARRLLRAANAPCFVVRRGMSVSGPVRTGKSTAIMHAGKRLENRLRIEHNRVDDPSYLPIVYVSITAATTPNKLWAVLAEFVGVRQLRGRNSDGRMFDLTQMLHELGTRFVIIDDVQRLNTDRIAGAEVADTLKTFAEHLDATMIYAGVSLRTAPLFTGPVGAQWRARTLPIEMHPYSLRTGDKEQEWRELIATFENYLPLPLHKPGTLVADAQYLFHRTGGSIATLNDLIADAGVDAIDTGEEKITRELLDDVAVDANADLYGDNDAGAT